MKIQDPKMAKLVMPKSDASKSQPKVAKQVPQQDHFRSTNVNQRLDQLLSDIEQKGMASSEIHSHLPSREKVAALLNSEAESLPAEPAAREQWEPVLSEVISAFDQQGAGATQIFDQPSHARVDNLVS